MGALPTTVKRIGFPQTSDLDEHGKFVWPTLGSRKSGKCWWNSINAQK